MMHNTEDKEWWTKHGSRKEEDFVRDICPRIPLNAQINPKKINNPYLPDLIVDGELADLKYQTTPFFKAGVIYGIDPQFAVTFNHKDFNRYKEKYPEITVYYWINWESLEKTIRREVFIVPYLFGVWKAPFNTIQDIITNGGVQSHEYQRRRGDKLGNAKDSYVFDVRWFEEIYREHEHIEDEF